MPAVQLMLFKSEELKKPFVCISCHPKTGIAPPLCDATEANACLTELRTWVVGLRIQRCLPHLDGDSN